MKLKKGQWADMKKGIMMVVIIAILIWVATAYLKNTANQTQNFIDTTCYTRSLVAIKNPTYKGSKVDLDGDGYLDYLCDNCICSKGGGCDNRKVTEGGNDLDGDGLPKMCDANDEDNKAVFHAENCKIENLELMSIDTIKDEKVYRCVIDSVDPVTT